LPFVNLFPLTEAPLDVKIVEPVKDYKQIKSYGDYLKCHLLSKIDIKPTKSVTLIQRTKNRIISNYDEIYSVLKKTYDVIPVNLDDLPFLKQLEILYNSKTIIMPHGAAMTFCLLLSKQTKIIELYPSYFNSLSYYSNLAEKFGIPHVEIECYSVPGSGHIVESEARTHEQIQAFLNGKLNKSGKYDAKDIHENHRLRSLLRDVKYITADVHKIKSYL
jgi:hypothetical protein